MAFEYAVALTGGIATGKSSATAMLMLYGFKFIDADKIAHAMLDTHAVKIGEMFGEAYLEKGKVNRKKLGGLIFGNPNKKKELENFLHPLIYNEIEAQAIKQDSFKKPYIIDIPLFFETSRYPISHSIVVYATKAQQLERLIKREGYNEDEALQRINAQMDIESKKQKATFVIDNSDDIKHLQSECERVKEEVLKAFNL
ncbi:MAG: dephospho-CoA kinase [Campylobacterales bacterium]|nr:dephospho-CoA kinase [Campylobacterales bacterium]